MKRLIILAFLVFLISCSKVEKQEITSTEQLPPLKIFSQAGIIGEVKNIINDNSVSIIVTKINNYTYLQSDVKLIEEGDNLTLHLTGIGEKKNWKIKELSEGAIFSTKIRCLDGRINSLELFAKEKCYWEADETSITIQ